MAFWNRNEWKDIDKNMIKGKRSRGIDLDAELKLLRLLAKHSTVLIPRENIYKYGDNLANIEALLKDGLISEEKTIESGGKEKIFYRITPSGYRFVQEENVRKRNKIILIITATTLIISIISFLVRLIFKI